MGQELVGSPEITLPLRSVMELPESLPILERYIHETLPLLQFRIAKVALDKKLLRSRAGQDPSPRSSFDLFKLKDYSRRLLNSDIIESMHRGLEKCFRRVTLG